MLLANLVSGNHTEETR